jgi:hypothetical protein
MEEIYNISETAFKNSTVHGAQKGIVLIFKLFNTYNKSDREQYAQIKLKALRNNDYEVLNGSDEMRAWFSLTKQFFSKLCEYSGEGLGDKPLKFYIDMYISDIVRRTADELSIILADEVLPNEIPQ